MAVSVITVAVHLPTGAMQARVFGACAAGLDELLVQGLAGPKRADARIGGCQPLPTREACYGFAPNIHCMKDFRVFRLKTPGQPGNTGANLIGSF